MGQRHPQLSWSAQSRFVVDEIVELPDWAISSTKFELLAEVAGKPEKVGVIYVSEIFKNLDKHDSFPEVPASAPTPAPEPALALAPAAAPAIATDKRIPPFVFARRVVDH